jgi:hypothetical protein
MSLLLSEDSVRVAVDSALLVFFRSCDCQDNLLIVLDHHFFFDVKASLPRKKEIKSFSIRAIGSVILFQSTNSQVFLKSLALSCFFLP